MLYRQMGKTGDSVSVLGYGCMRLPQKDKKIDEARAERQLKSAIDRGVNYVDTAYLYHGRKGEAAVGRILSTGYRDKVLLATKLPPMMAHSQKAMETVLSAQLEHLQTDHIDYYLIHALMGIDGWQRLKQAGIEEFLERARRTGKIRHVGFSYHGDRDQFRALVDDYSWDMCQIQYNYLDEQHQAGREGLRYAATKGLGVVVMEPLRGGFLAGQVPAPVQAIWDKATVRRTPAEWGLRWVWNHPEISVVLSGMNDEVHIDENLQSAESACAGSLARAELSLIAEARDALSSLMKVACTGCAYCMPCPSGVNIPLCFQTFNSKHMFDSTVYQRFYLIGTGGLDGGKPSYASLCEECGKCEEKCPQHLPIRSHLVDVAKEMQPFYFIPAVKTVGAYFGFRSMLRRGPGATTHR